MKTYKGIDYGLGKTNVDRETGIRFGVISQNSICPEAMDDVYQNSEDLTHKACVEELKREIRSVECESELAAILNERFHCRCQPHLWAQAILLDYTLDDGTLSEPMDDELADHIWSEIEDTFNDQYDDCGDRNWLHESDGYKLTNCLQSDVMILASRFYTYAQFCSPCVPGACNLDSPLITPPDGVFGGNNFDADWKALRGNKCYCLGHDWFENGRAPYCVYSVETGELVPAVQS